MYIRGYCSSKHKDQSPLLRSIDECCAYSQRGPAGAHSARAPNIRPLTLMANRVVSFARVHHRKRRNRDPRLGPRICAIRLYYIDPRDWTSFNTTIAYLLYIRMRNHWHNTCRTKLNQHLYGVISAISCSRSTPYLGVSFVYMVI